MKKMKLWGIMLVIVMALPFVLSCGNDGSDNSDASLVLNMNEVQMTVGDKALLSSNIPCTFKSDNTDIVTVNANGQISAIRAGNANIIAESTSGKQSASCAVFVSWKYNFMDEPLLNFNLSKDEVKSKETHEFVVESYFGNDSPAHTVLNYTYYLIDKPTQVSYYFYNSIGSMYKITFSLAVKYSEHYFKQMEERYGLPIIGKTQYNKKIYTYQLENYYIKIVETNDSYWTVTYQPNE